MGELPFFSQRVEKKKKLVGDAAVRTRLMNRIGQQQTSSNSIF